MVAVVAVPEVQLTLLVKSAVLVSEKVPTALNCCVSPTGRLAAAGVIAIDSRPLTKETLSRLVDPAARYEVKTPLGNIPLPGTSVTTSPAFNETAPPTAAPLTDNWPLLAETDVPAN